MKYIVTIISVLCTGYPVLRNKVDFKRTDKAANKEDLNRIVTATKVTAKSHM